MNLTRTDGARTTARTTSSAHRDRDDERDDLDPTAIARNVCEMWWPELDRLSQRLLNRMALIAEAPGARLQPDLIHHGKAGGGRPHATPWHQDGSLSMRDHWERRLARAADEDLATADQVPRRLQQAVLRAAYDLRSVTHRPEREAATPSPTTPARSATSGSAARPTSTCRRTSSPRSSRPEPAGSRPRRSVAPAAPTASGPTTASSPRRPRTPARRHSRSATRV